MDKTVGELRSELKTIAYTKKDRETVYLIVPKQWRHLLWQMHYEYIPAMPQEKHYEGTFYGCFVVFEFRDDIGVERVDWL